MTTRNSSARGSSYLDHTYIKVYSEGYENIMETTNFVSKRAREVDGWTYMLTS